MSPRNACLLSPHMFHHVGGILPFWSNPSLMWRRCFKFWYVIKVYCCYWKVKENDTQNGRKLPLKMWIRVQRWWFNIHKDFFFKNLEKCAILAHTELFLSRFTQEAWWNSFQKVTLGRKSSHRVHEIQDPIIFVECDTLHDLTKKDPLGKILKQFQYDSP